MRAETLQTPINQLWNESIIPALFDFIKIPNKSPMFDSNWQAHGYMDQAIKLIKEWCQQHAPKNMRLEVLQHGNRTPLIFMDIPGQTPETVLLYGHLDKQPEMEGWDPDLGPWKPVLKGEKLYGRGAADDGYAAFAAIAAIKALQHQQIPHARCVILIEACEESGSLDLPFYIDILNSRLGNPSLVICLDSGCGNYQQLWSTTSLRGIVGGVLSVKVLTEGVHSGAGSGIVPSSFCIIRELLSRVENPSTGEILLDSLYVEIPQQRILQAQEVAKVLGKSIYSEFSWVDQVKPITTDPVELLLNSTWRPTLTVTGIAGLPSVENAGNVLHGQTALKLSFRIPPHCDAKVASDKIKTTLEANPPYHAQVEFQVEEFSAGWDAPPLANWLKQAADKASNTFFGQPCCYTGEGGSIPFMGMLGEKFPAAQFLITGVLGPHSNAHGPNEFLHLPTAKKLTACVAQLLVDHYQYKNRI